MIAEVEKEKNKFLYVIKHNKKNILYSKEYSSRQSAIRGFRRLKKYINSENISICNEPDCFHIEILDSQNRIMAHSPNLGSKEKVIILKNKIMQSNIPIKDERRNKMHSYIYQIGDYNLNSPITIKITKEDDYIASIEDLNLFAYGDNLDEVLDEIKEDLQELYKDLFERNHNLAEPAAKYKRHIENLLK